MVTSEILNILNAYKEGKTIQYSEMIPNAPKEWMDLNTPPFWNFEDYEYRIKPKETVEPYQNIQEFLDAMKKHGPMVFFSKTVSNMPLTCIEYSEGRILVEFQTPAYTSMKLEDLVKYKWQDKTPCGNVKKD